MQELIREESILPGRLCGVAVQFCWGATGAHCGLFGGSVLAKGRGLEAVHIDDSLHVEIVDHKGQLDIVIRKVGGNPARRTYPGDGLPGEGGLLPW